MKAVKLKRIEHFVFPDTPQANAERWLTQQAAKKKGYIVETDYKSEWVNGPGFWGFLDTHLDGEWTLDIFERVEEKQ